jgi:hypothetical protein
VVKKTVFITSFEVHLNSKTFFNTIFTNHMVIPYRSASCSSVHPNMASPPTQCLMQELFNNCQPPPHLPQSI